jgi:hypothetical protein
MKGFRHHGWKREKFLLVSKLLEKKDGFFSLGSRHRMPLAVFLHTPDVMERTCPDVTRTWNMNSVLQRGEEDKSDYAIGLQVQGEKKELESIQMYRWDTRSIRGQWMTIFSPKKEKERKQNVEKKSYLPSCRGFFLS